jgi:hypothetical protein
MLKDYYTQEHYTSEELVRKHLENLYNLDLRRNKTLYKYDISVVKNGVVTGLLELKRRNYPYGKYDTYTVSLDKIREGVVYSLYLGIPCTLVVFFSCGTLVSYRIDAQQVKGFDITYGGRTDRNDPNDLEPLVNIPIAFFKVLDILPTFKNS